jgi:hypothetical protein
MNAQEILHYQQTRWRKPWVWVVVLGWSSVSMLSALVIHPPARPLSPWEFLFFALCQVLLFWTLVQASPLPWLWSGRSGNFPGVGRALAQGILLGMASLVTLSMLETLRHTLGGEPSLKQLWTELRENSIEFTFLFSLVGFWIASIEKETLAKKEAQKKAWKLSGSY